MSFEIITPDNNPLFWDYFLSMPDIVYRKDPFYCHKHTPKIELFEGKKQILFPFVALQSGRAVARLCVWPKSVFKKYDEKQTAVIGMFEAIDNYDVVKRLLDRALDFLRQRGVRRAIGPMDGDTWHTYRFNIGPFSEHPFLMEPHNPSYYPKFWEHYGFKVLTRYFSKRIQDVSLALPILEHFYKRTLRNGFTYHPFNTADFDKELHTLYQLSCKIYIDNCFYSEISKKDFYKLYAGSKSIIDKDLVWFSKDKKGDYAGFVFAFPDYFDAVRAMQGSRNFWARAKFLLNRHRADTLNAKSLGVLPKYNGTGLGTALIYKIYKEGYAKGLHKVNMCLIQEENVSRRMDGGKGTISRHYHLYKYEIE
jgi:GNAT superfamily N-acetyltransferase